MAGNLKRTLMLICLSLGILYCQTVFADTITGKDGNWEYEISEEYENDGKKEYATLKKYLGSETNVIVPATIDGLKIKTLNSTFSDNTTVEFVIIPEGITELYNTFTGCTSLKHVNLPTSITMYNAAFPTFSYRGNNYSKRILRMEGAVIIL